MTNINFQSDFKINEVSESIDLATPFKFTYTTSSSMIVRYVASFDGHQYTNCRPLDDGSLLVIFDRHALLSGHLQVRREYFLTDSDFADGIYNLVSYERLDVVLTTGASDSDGDITIEVYPAYQQGPQGFTPYVGDNGNWWINGEDTGYMAVVFEQLTEAEYEALSVKENKLYIVTND